MPLIPLKANDNRTTLPTRSRRQDVPDAPIHLETRQRSIRAVFDYSWNLLSDDERNVFRQLTVFRGGFTREAVQAVTGASLRTLASLVNKSMLRRDPNGRYEVHELLRQYAFEKLLVAGEADKLQAAHLNYYVKLTSNPDSLVHGEKQTLWLEQLETEHDNLRIVLAWARDHPIGEARKAGLSLGAPLWEFWLMRGHITEGRQWLDRLLVATDGTISLARGSVTQGAGYLAWIQGEQERAEALHREGLAMRQTLNDKAGIGGSLSNLQQVA